MKFRNKHLMKIMGYGYYDEDLDEDVEPDSSYLASRMLGVSNGYEECEVVFRNDADGLTYAFIDRVNSEHGIYELCENENGHTEAWRVEKKEIKKVVWERLK